jgi:hypothetical protein
MSPLYQGIDNGCTGSLYELLRGDLFDRTISFKLQMQLDLRGGFR